MRLPDFIYPMTGLQSTHMAKMMYRIVCVILSVLMLAPDIGHAETAGKIAGVIRDKATQDPLPGVNIKIVGTSLRAISGPYGEYFVLNVPIGVYAIEAQMMGYLTVQNSSVSVNADLTTRVNFSLHTTVLDLNETLTITAPRSLIRPDLTASSDVITADDLRPLPITSIADLITLQSGTVRDANGGLHIRGGRSDEISYYVDGTEFRDPMLGGMSTTLNLDTIEEVVINRGGFDAQYGDAMSGIVNIMTKEGATDYTGRFRSSLSLQPQYNVINGAFGGPAANGRNLSGSFAGRMPLLGKTGSFFIAGQQQLTGNYLPHHAMQNQSLAGNITFRPHRVLKLKIGGHFADRHQEIYDHRNDRSGLSYDFNLDGLPERWDRSYALNLSVNHSITPRTFYTARFFRYTTKSKLAPSMFFDDYWTDWPGYSEDNNGRYTGHIYKDNLQASDQYSGMNFTGGEDFLPWYRQAETTYYGVRFDLSSQLTYRNQLRFGMEGQWYRLSWDEKSFQSETPSGELYDANPVEGAFYLQNKLELAQLIFNAGVRLDYFDTGQRFFINMPNGQAELRNSPTKLRLSPRLGLSHPITSKSLVRLSYGYFYQPPEFRFVYENLRSDLTNELPRLGNPNLDPQKTVAYEIGFEHLFTDNTHVGLTASYKTLSNLTTTTQIRYPGGSYSIFTNADFGLVQSLEFSLKQRMVRNISGSLHYTLSSAEGSASDPQEKYNRLAKTPDGEIEIPTDSVFPLAFDQRHTVTGIISMYTPRNWDKKFLGFPLKDVSMTLIGQYGSGLPYTPTNSTNEQLNGLPNSARLPALFDLDLRLHKRFRMGNTSYTFFTEVENLLNRRNVINVYSNTGSPVDDGYKLETLANQTPEQTRLRRLFSLDPQNFSAPREIRVGFEVTF